MKKETFDIQGELENYLKDMTSKTGLGVNLRVVWQPNQHAYSKEGKLLSGKVINETIIIFEADLDKAKETLLHEYTEYIIDQCCQPYRALLNLLISYFESEYHKAREKTMKGLMELLG